MSEPELFPRSRVGMWRPLWKANGLSHGQSDETPAIFLASLLIFHTRDDWKCNISIKNIVFFNGNRQTQSCNKLKSSKWQGDCLLKSVASTYLLVT